MTSTTSTKTTVAKLDAALDSVVNRNKVVQQKKKSGATGWIIALVLSLLALVGIGVAVYLYKRRSRELAALKTKAEIDELEQAAKKEALKHADIFQKRESVLRKLKKEDELFRARKNSLVHLYKEHAERKKRLAGLRSWKEINEA